VTVPSYPGYPGAAPAPKSRPTIVTVATYLLFLVAFLELVDAVVGFSVYPKISDAIKDAYAGTGVEGAGDVAGVSSVIGAVVNLLFAAGLTVLGLLDGRGRNVARIITWVVGGLSLCCLGLGLGSSALVSSVNGDTSTGGPSSTEVQDRISAALPSWYEGTTVTIAVVSLLAILAVIILLALPASNEFFRKQPAGFDPAYYPGAYGQPGYPGQPGQSPYPAPGQSPYPAPGQSPYPAPGQSPYPAPGQSPYPAPGQPQQPGGYGQPGQPAPGLPPYPGGPGTPPPPPGGQPPYPGGPETPGQQPPSDPS
jgi:hypothetical protein